MPCLDISFFYGLWWKHKFKECQEWKKVQALIKDNRKIWETDHPAPLPIQCGNWKSELMLENTKNDYKKLELMQVSCIQDIVVIQKRAIEGDEGYDFTAACSNAVPVLGKNQLLVEKLQSRC